MPTNRTRLKRERRDYKKNQQVFWDFFMYGIDLGYYAKVKPLEKPEGLFDLFLMQHPNEKDNLLSVWQTYRREILRRWDHPEIEPYGVLVFDKQKEIIDLEIYRKLFDEN